MALVDLSLLKAHVRADDFTEDDAYLSSVLESAEAWVVQATAREADELVELGGGAFPSQLRQAVLLLAGHWYNQREAGGPSSLAEVPYTVQALVKPFRKLSDTTSGGGGDYDELEARVTALEDRADAMDERVDRVEGAIPTIEEISPSEVKSDWDEIMNE